MSFVKRRFQMGGRRRRMRRNFMGRWGIRRSMRRRKEPTSCSVNSLRSCSLAPGGFKRVLSEKMRRSKLKRIMTPFKVME